MKKNIKGILTGAMVALISNAIANYVTLGSVVPTNVIVGLIIGGSLGYVVMK